MIKVSWSALRRHVECAQRSYLARTGKRAATQNSRGFLPGTVTDRVVRDWLMDDPHNNPGIMPEMVSDILSREEGIIKENTDRGEYVKYKNVEDRDNVIAECIEAVTLIEPALEKLVLPFEYVADYKFETPVTVNNKRTEEPIQVLLNGFMDIMVKDANGDYAVWDVKHTRNNDYWKKTSGQLAFYDVAILSMFNKKTSYTGLLQPLCKEKVKALPVLDTTRVKLLNDIAQMATDIVYEYNEPTTDKNACFFCEFKHACVKFKKSDTGRVSFFGN